MADINMPAFGNREDLRRKLSRMSPAVRNEVINEGISAEIKNHIVEDKDGYKVDLLEVDKKFPTYVEAEIEVKKIFNDNPRLSNFSDLEK
jgi:methionine synthase II (cobalamin-independent)